MQIVNMGWAFIRETTAYTTIGNWGRIPTAKRWLQRETVVGREGRRLTPMGVCCALCRLRHSMVHITSFCITSARGRTDKTNTDSNMAGYFEHSTVTATCYFAAQQQIQYQ